MQDELRIKSNEFHTIEIIGKTCKPQFSFMRIVEKPLLFCENV